ncbi:hypothetical protein MAM1_0439d10516 [Mucor ambiguus]|uniref:WW domain-containing protein n=1 Tax=Mucor ambiguus TaxID=91626 RepID=A0A0C9MJE2_9FUNG|nr:hypothetical protein MAM1_0439d10516 [Mucor ambiguus]
MNSSYHTSTTENGHRRSDSRRQTRFSGDTYDSHRQSSSRAHEREQDTPTATKDSTHSSNSALLMNRDEIVLSYPEKAIPAKEPVISLDIEDDEERIMQADWGNESDDEEDHATMQKQHKRLSTVEREEIERTDRESKGIWVRHTADDGRPYYYNSVTRESVWEIPKSATATPVPTASIRIASSAINTHSATKHAKASHASTTRTGSDRSSSRPYTTHSDTISKKSQLRSNSEPTAITSSNNTAKATTVKRDRDHTKEKDDAEVQGRARNDVSTATNTNADIGQRSNSANRSTVVQTFERRTSYNSRERSREKRSRLEASRSSHRSGYMGRRSRSRSPLPPPPPRDLYYDSYRYHHRSPSPPPYRHYPPYYHPYDDRIRHSPPPDLRYRYYELSPPPPLSPPPYYHRSRERSWERYETAHRARYYR